MSGKERRIEEEGTEERGDEGKRGDRIKEERGKEKIGGFGGEKRDGEE